MSTPLLPRSGWNTITSEADTEKVSAIPKIGVGFAPLENLPDRLCEFVVF